MGSRWLSRLAVATAAAGALTLSTATASWAAPAPEPRLVEGNVATCEQAGLTGTILFGGETGSGSGPAGSGTVTGNELDVTINAGFTASGIVVKGGPNANVYEGPFVGPTTVEGMVAPATPSGGPAGISHWFVCGEETPESPPPSTPGSPPPSDGNGNGSTPPGNGSTPPAGGGGLPVTGPPVAGIFLAGIGLLAAGMALMAVRRRRAISELTES